jgi:hypothetical protein
MEDSDTPLQSDGPSVGSHDPLVQRPKQVARAVALLWISLALAPLVLVLDKSATQVPISYSQSALTARNEHDKRSIQAEE